MTARPTIQDVANLAGVHPATVSRALDPRLEGRIAAQVVSHVAWDLWIFLVQPTIELDD